MTSYTDIEVATRAAGLIVMGALPHEGGTVVLLGAGPAFWPVLQASPEGMDGKPDPVDRWSTRVIGALAQRFNAEPRFPFGHGLGYTTWAIGGASISGTVADGITVTVPITNTGSRPGSTVAVARPSVASS